MNPYREELRKILDTLETERSAALRRSRSEEWLYSTDLPLAASERTLETFIRQADQAGWKVKREDGWIQLDRKINVFLPGMIPEGWTTSPTAACCRSLLERHRDCLIPSDGIAERLLLKAGEESRESYEEACRKLHARWAERLRCHQGIPDVDMRFFSGGE